MSRPGASGAACALSSAGLAILLATGPPPEAQQLVRSEDAIVALFSLQTQIDVDTRVLQRMELRQEENRRSRDEAQERVQRAYADLDRVFAQYRQALRARDVREEDEDQPPERDTPSIDALETQLEAREQEVIAAERVETAVRDDGRRLREDIRTLHERIRLQTQKIESLQASIPTQRDSVTGLWEITMLPGGEKGVFALFQSGTIVTGQYVLDGPFQGSLEGTLIDRRVLLHRIDSRLGRSMDLTGFLSPDGLSVRGTWENYDLANGQARTGSWAARRRQPRSGDEAEGSSGREGGP